jgi:hypothetical protein
MPHNHATTHLDIKEQECCDGEGEVYHCQFQPARIQYTQEM